MPGREIENPWETTINPVGAIGGIIGRGVSSREDPRTTILSNRFANGMGFIPPRSNFQLQGTEQIFPPDPPDILEPKIEQVPPDFLQEHHRRRVEGIQNILKYLLGIDQDAPR